jgi:hypothetical protein
VDGARLARESDYNNQEMNEALAAFTLARQQNITAVAHLGEEQLERTGVLEGVGRITLRALLLMMHEHDEGHLEELNRILDRRL